MAKDPAFLFYPGDWQGGTATYSRHLKGCYMDILIAQFNSGPLSLEEIKTVLGSDFGSTWPTLQKKFALKSGLYFNVRLEEEKLKRKEFAQSRRDNVLKRYSKSTHVDTSEEHLKLRTENRDINENTNRVEVINGAGAKWQVFYPFESEEFLTLWTEWKEYLKTIKKPYQTFSAEQAGLQFVSKFNEATAKEMIKQAMRNSWKNLREVEVKKTESKIEGAVSVLNQQEQEIEKLYGNRTGS